MMKKVISVLFLLGGMLFMLSDLLDYHESRQANAYVLTLYKQNKLDIQDKPDIQDTPDTLLEPQAKANNTLTASSIDEAVLPEISKISIPSLDLEYPIMKGTDNAYYLNHDPEGNKNKYGSLFWDYKGRPLIFGHNAGTGVMFGKLKQLKGGEFVYINEIPYKVSSVALVETTKIMAIDTLSLITCHGDPSIRLVVTLEKAEDLF